MLRWCELKSSRSFPRKLATAHTHRVSGDVIPLYTKTLRCIVPGSE